MCRSEEDTYEKTFSLQAVVNSNPLPKLEEWLCVIFLWLYFLIQLLKVLNIFFYENLSLHFKLLDC